MTDTQSESSGKAIDTSSLLIHPEAGWLRRFATGMFLASLIAALGMRLNSPPIIIGAMLIAPLMGPLLGTAFGMVTKVERRDLVRTTSLLAGSVVGVAAVGLLTAAFVPSSEVGIATEVLARTAPDRRDFLVAVAAGAAGAYAAFQPRVSSSLPGVAVAVALVPPLVAAGITAGEGATSLTVGAFTLFAANVVGIIIGAVATMLLMAAWSSVAINLDGTRMVRSFVDHRCRDAGPRRSAGFGAVCQGRRSPCRAGPANRGRSPASRIRRNHGRRRSLDRFVAAASAGGRQHQF